MESFGRQPGIWLIRLRAAKSSGSITPSSITMAASSRSDRAISISTSRAATVAPRTTSAPATTRLREMVRISPPCSGKFCALIPSIQRLLLAARTQPVQMADCAPVSNPFVATLQPANRVAEIYAYGLRNPFRFSFDAASDKFIVGDVGQNNIEEVDIVEAGKNYGWNKKEGTFLFNPADGTVSPDFYPDPSLINPIAEYSHADGEAVLGGFVYHRKRSPLARRQIRLRRSLHHGAGRRRRRADRPVVLSRWPERGDHPGAPDWQR